MKKLLLTAVCLILALAPAAFAEPEDIFRELETVDFSFSSGVGGWSTDLKFSADGSFTGYYHDSEMGETGDGYPDGTVYLTSFIGQMTVIDGTTLHVAWLATDIAEESIEDGIRYVPAEPYGIGDGDDFVIHRPGTPVSALSDDMQFWAHLFDDESAPETLDSWFLENTNGESGFVGYEFSALMPNPWEENLTADELAALTGLSFRVPEGAENAVYRCLPAETLAEMQFTIGPDEYCARIKSVEDLEEGLHENISDMYFAWKNEIVVSVRGNAGSLGQAQTGSGEWVELCMWREDDLMYSLSVYTTDPDGLDLTAVAEQL